MIRKGIIILLQVIFLVGCTKQLMVKEYYLPKKSIQMFGQTTGRQFSYPVELTDSLELAWENSTKGSFNNNSVLIEDNYLYITDLAGNLFCFQADSGKTIGADKSSGEVAVAPILDEGNLYYVNTVDGETYSILIRYNIKKGERAREVKIPGRVGNEILKYENGIFLVSDNGLARYYDLYLDVVWEYDIGKNVFSSPAGNNSVILVPTFDGEIISLSREDGKEVLRKKISHGFESALVIQNHSGYIGNNNGELLAFDISTGEIHWKSNTEYKIKIPPVMSGHRIFISNLGGSVYCFDINNGALIWKYLSDGIFNTPPALFNNVLLQPDLNEKLLFINPVNGEVVKTWQFEERLKLHPVYFNGMLYIGIDRGEILAYKLVKEL